MARGRYSEREYDQRDRREDPSREITIIPPSDEAPEGVPEELSEYGRPGKYDGPDSSGSSHDSDSDNGGPPHGFGGPPPPPPPFQRQRPVYNPDEYDKNLKMKQPDTYDGKQDIDVFDDWATSITNYADVMKVSEGTMIKMMTGALAQLIYQI